MSARFRLELAEPVAGSGSKDWIPVLLQKVPVEQSVFPHYGYQPVTWPWKLKGLNVFRFDSTPQFKGPDLVTYTYMGEVV